VNTAHVWRAALEQLRRELSRAQFDTWLRGTQLVLTDDGACELRVRTTFAKDMLETRYRERIEAAIAEVAGAPCALRIAVIAGESEGDGDETTSARRGLSRRSQQPADDGGYDRPALFAAPDEPLPPTPRSPGASSPRQALPPAANASRSERIRAALDRGRACIAGGCGSARPRVPSSGCHKDDHWTD
jgi:chromosomal replication initiation ATPase DnaA